jgi:hypothetical protein
VQQREYFNLQYIQVSSSDLHRLSVAFPVLQEWRMPPHSFPHNGKAKVRINSIQVSNSAENKHKRRY